MIGLVHGPIVNQINNLLFFVQKIFNSGRTTFVNQINNMNEYNGSGGLVHGPIVNQINNLLFFVQKIFNSGRTTFVNQINNLLMFLFLKANI
jgi:hypothetical protein